MSEPQKMPRTRCLVATLLLAVLNLPAQDAKSPLDLTPSEDVPASWGKSFRGTLASQALGEARSFRLWLPASHAATARRYPTVFVTDGDHHFVDVVTAVRQLAQAGHVPECVVVGVSTRARTQDLTPPGMDAYIAEGEARGDRLLRFLAEELAPALAAQRSTRPFVLLGHSHGAILAHHAAAAWRREFPFVIALDGPMHLSDHWLCHRLETSVAKGGHLRLVSLEARFGWSDAAWQRFAAAAPKDWQLTRRNLAGDDHNSMVFAGYLEGLRTVFRDYSAVPLRNASGPEAFAHYRNLVDQYGAECTPPFQVLERTLMDLVIRGERDKAMHTLALMRAGYGKPDDPADFERRAETAAAAMHGQPSVEQLLATPRPTVAEMEPFLGTWQGPIGFEGHRPINTVTFQSTGDRVEGMVEIQETSTDVQKLAVQYLRVTPKGLDFGYMNGMYPRGLLVHTTAREGDRLVGRIELRGVHFEPPRGHTPPVYEIDLRRVDAARR